MEEKKKLNPLIPICAVLVVLLALVGFFCVMLRQKKIEEYQSTYNNLMSDMLDDAVAAENIGNRIVSVWHNAIWRIDDDETDEFTKVNGDFVEDFNDALRNLFNDENFSKDTSTLSSNQQHVKEEMKGMLNPPKGYENAFKALEDMYNSYISFTDTVLDCEGSLESFSNDFGECDDNFIDFYHRAELYVK